MANIWLHHGKSLQELHVQRETQAKSELKYMYSSKCSLWIQISQIKACRLKLKKESLNQNVTYKVCLFHLIAVVDML